MAQDFQLDTDGDLKISSGGDFRIANSDMQHIHDHIETNRGEWKEFPLVGVGIMQHLNGETSVAGLERQIRINLLADKFRNVSVSVNKSPNGTFNITTDAEHN